jgi:hypothetical protein
MVAGQRVNNKPFDPTISLGGKRGRDRHTHLRLEYRAMAMAVVSRALDASSKHHN